MIKTAIGLITMMVLAWFVGGCAPQTMQEFVQSDDLAYRSSCRGRVQAHAKAIQQLRYNPPTFDV
ncbi:MAG TPA: hypothetical protein DCQ06_02820 [Myxococcales bacterium]|nr:hypothetical protein [Myxococcales bacterium]